jgi:hypothetical protein
MNRLAGIIVAVIGLLICVLSIVKVTPGLVGTGIALILLGGLVIGLSFVDKPATEGVEEMSTPGTLAGVFFYPGDTFKNLRFHPRWLVPLLILSALSAAYTNAFIQHLGAERVANYAIDKTLEMSIINEEARKQIEAGRQQAITDTTDPVKRTGQAINGFVATVFWTAFLAGIFFLFALAMGGKMNYWQAFSVAAYSSFAVGVVRLLLSFIFLYIKDPAEIHPLMGQSSLVQDSFNFLVKASEHPVIYVLLGAVSVLALYWIVLSIIGLKNAGEKVSTSIAATATIVVWAVGVVLGVVLALLFPSFLS